MRFRSIGVKLTVWYTSLLTLTFILLGSAAYGLLAYSLSKEMDAALNGVADVLARRTQGGRTPFFPAEVDEAFRRFFGFSPLDRYIDLFDPLGERDPRQSRTQSKKLTPSPEALKNAAQGLPTFETIQVEGSAPVRVLTKPVMEVDRVSNLVMVGMSLENMLHTRRRFLLIMASVLPLGLLLAGIGGWFLARRALRPVDHMTRTAQRISGEYLNERLQVSGNGDELDRLARTINEMLGRLDEAFVQMRQFSADASHELQTPLTILKGEIEVALRQERNTDEYRRVLQSGLEEVDRLSRLVDGLLLLSRVDAGVQKLDLRPVNLSALSWEIIKQMGLVADKHAVNLQAEIPGSVTIRGDSEHLRRLLLNLVDNAIKYTPSGGDVTLSLDPGPEWVTLKVSDTGIGLSENDIKKVFNRFHRVTDARSKDVTGVGLGLSIVQSIVEAHGGRIHVDSAPGQGSVFTIHIPSPVS